MKNRKIIIILFIFSIIFIGCYSYNRTVKQGDDNCEDCGTIVFKFKKDQIEDAKPILLTHKYIYSFLSVLIKINGEVVFDDIISDDTLFQKKIHEGDLNISYSVFTENFDGINSSYSYTGFKNNKDCFYHKISQIREKNLKLELKSNQIIYLKLVKFGKVHKRCVLTSVYGIGLERALPFQRIAFEVEKIEEDKPVNSEKNDIGN